MNFKRIIFILSGFLTLYGTSLKPAQAEGSYIGDGMTSGGDAVSANNGGGAVDSVIGSFGSSAKGNSVYSLSFKLPPARLQPKLGLAYSSDAGFGYEGPYGWQISGVMSITKPRGRLEHLYEDDEYLISGSVSGILFEYLPGKYHIKTRSNVFVEATYNAGTDVWVVKARGVTYTLSRHDGANDGSSETLQWRIDTAIDQYGNKITFTYAPGSERLTQVSYGGNTGTGAHGAPSSPHHVEVDFNYTSLTPYLVRGETKFYRNYNQVLDQVEVRVVGGGVLDTYRYDFTLATSGLRKLLSKVTLFSDGSTQTIAEFEYGLEDTSLAETEVDEIVSLGLSKSLSLGNPSDFPSRYSGYSSLSVSYGLKGLYDVNGDGLKDVVTSGIEFLDDSVGWPPEQDQSWIDEISDFIDNPTAASGGWQTRLYELDEDEKYKSDWAASEIGFSDLGLPLSQQVTYRANGWSDSDPSGRYAEIKTADVDGDGYFDVIESYDSTIWNVHYGNPIVDGSDEYFDTDGDGTGDVSLEVAPSGWRFSEQGYVPVAKDYDTYSPTDERWNMAVRRTLMDFNGDGWLDLLDGDVGSVCLHRGGRALGWEPCYSISATLDTKGVRVMDYVVETVYRDTDGNGSNETYQMITKSRVVEGFADMNGDGLLDYVDTTPWTAGTAEYWLVTFNNGTKLEETVTWDSPYQFMEISFDGKPEVHFAEVEIDPGPSDIKEFNITEPAVKSETRQRLMDVDGDGLIDIVKVGDSEWYRNTGRNFELTPKTIPAYYGADLGSSRSETHIVQGTSSSVSRSGVQRALLDINGDRSADMVDKNTAGMKYGSHQPIYKLTKVKNNLGGERTITYRSSTRFDQTKSDGTTDMPRPRDLVLQVDTKDNVTMQSRRKIFDYRGGTSDQGKFVGFEEIEEQRGELGGSEGAINNRQTALIKSFEGELEHATLFGMAATKETLLDYTYPLTSLLQASVRTIKTNVYAMAGDYRRLSYQTAENQKWGFLDLESSSEHLTNYQWDTTYGHLLWKTTEEGLAATGLNYAKTEYDTVFNADHTLRRVGHIQVKNLAGDVQAETRNYYDSNTGYTGVSITQGELSKKEVLSGWVGGGESLNASSLITEYEYNDWGQLEKSIGEEYRTSDGSLNKLETIYGYGYFQTIKTSETNELGTVTYDLDPGTGAVTKVTGVNGDRVRYEHDDFDRVVATYIKGVGGSASEYKVSETDYVAAIGPDFRGNPNHIKSRVFNVNPDPLTGDLPGAGSESAESETILSTNGFGESIQTISDHVTGEKIVTNVAFDKFGRAKGTSYPQLHASLSAPMGGTYSFPEDLTALVFDGRGNVIQSYSDKESYPSSFSERRVDVPEEITVVDSEGYALQQEYDIYGHVTRVSKGVDGSPLAVVGNMMYDTMGRLESYTDANAVAWTYSYDGAGRLRQSQRDTVVMKTWFYNGNYVEKIYDTTDTGADYAVQYSVDDKGRTVEVNFKDPTLESGYGYRLFSYEYDGDHSGSLDRIYEREGRYIDGPTGYVGPGTVLGESLYEYDSERLHVSGLTRTFGGLHADVSFTYQVDLQGRTTRTDFPSGRDLSTIRTNGYLTRQDLVAFGTIDYDYDRFGKLTDWESDQGHKVDYTYTDSPFELNEITMAYDAVTQAKRTYSWKTNGLLETRGTLDPLMAETFTYDDRQQLTDVDRGAVTLEQFTYDGAGNLTALTRPDGESFTYGVGTYGQAEQRTNTGTSDKEVWGYNALGQRVSYDQDAHVASSIDFHYEYDGFGRLVQIKDGNLGVIKRFHRDANGTVIRRDYAKPTTGYWYKFSFGGWSYDERSLNTVEHITKELKQVNGSNVWMLSGYDGAMEETYDDAGTSTRSRLLGAYGFVTMTTGAPGVDLWLEESFHGIEREDDHEMFTMGVRQNGKDDGYWYQSEPLVFTGELGVGYSDPSLIHPYRYAGNSPRKYMDPSGMSPFGPDRAPPIFDLAANAPIGEELTQIETDLGQIGQRRGEIQSRIDQLDDRLEDAWDAHGESQRYRDIERDVHAEWDELSNENSDLRRREDRLETRRRHVQNRSYGEWRSSAGPNGTRAGRLSRYGPLILIAVGASVSLPAEAAAKVEPVVEAIGPALSGPVGLCGGNNDAECAKGGWDVTELLPPEARYALGRASFYLTHPTTFMRRSEANNQWYQNDFNLYEGHLIQWSSSYYGHGHPRGCSEVLGPEGEVIMSDCD